MSITIRVPISAIHVPELRASSKFTPEQLEFFRGTVNAVGVVQDPVVRRVGAGEYELVAGKTRLEELRSRGDTEITVKVIEADERTALFMHLAENVARGSVDPINVAKVMRRLHESGTDIATLSNVLGKSETWVRRTLALLDLPTEYQQAIKDAKLTPTHIYIAARMPTLYEVDDALRTALTHGWNTTIFETFVNNRIAQLEAAKKAAYEKGVEYAPPPIEPEKLTAYKQCLLCGYRVPIDQIQTQLVCEGCAELVSYITSQLGPWQECRETIHGALQSYFGSRRPPIHEASQPSREDAQE